MRIEPLRWWHIDALLPIEDDLFGVERWSAAMFWNELANGNYYLVALDGTGADAGDGPDAGGGDAGNGPDAGDGVDGGAVLGYAGLSVHGGEAWVQNIAVRRDQQRAGIGRRLLVALLDEAARRDARTVLLEVAVDNGAAQRLYTQYGFETVGVRKGYYQPTNTDALVMRRDG